MEILQGLYEGIRSAWPPLAAVVATVILIYIAKIIIHKKYSESADLGFRTQIITLVLALAGILALILTLPIGDTRQGQLLSLIGILLSAAIALSSTTFVGNAMAGMMIRALKNFRPGDYIYVGNWFGRVSDRGLFHIEIQTEDRDLTTLPNLFLVTNPVKVVRPSGTIISAEISLGYDIPHTKVRELLIKAALTAKIQDPFVHVIELGDFSVTYRLSGLLTDLKQLLTTRSRLREMMLDMLHQNHIEIVSPTFMNTRSLKEDQTFIPPVVKNGKPAPGAKDRAVPEDLVFDKAAEAESLAKLRERYESLGEEMDLAKEQVKEAETDAAREKIKIRIEQLDISRQKLAEIIKRREEEKKDE